MNKETKKEKIRRYAYIKLLMLLGVIILAILIYFGTEIYCDKWGDKYTMNSRCHNPIFRCTIECENYNWNFTGTINGCMCDCGEAYVSVCSGFAYNKTTKNIIKIHP